jgi:hypothetical protein
MLWLTSVPKRSVRERRYATGKEASETTRAQTMSNSSITVKALKYSASISTGVRSSCRYILVLGGGVLKLINALCSKPSGGVSIFAGRNSGQEPTVGIPT